MNLFDLFVHIGADTSEAESGINSLSGKLKTGLAGAAKVGAAAVGTFTAATAAMYTGVTKAAGEVAAFGDNIDKASQKIGVSAEFYQEWDAVLQHSGTSMDSMTTSFKTLANASQGATDAQQAAFEALGLSMEQVASMSTEELFENVIAGLQNMEEGTERTAIATDLLGKGAMELGALFNTSAEDTQAMIDTVNELGGVMSDEAVKASARYQDSLQDMQTSFNGLKNNLISNFLPGIATVMDGITALVSGDSGAQGKLAEGISQVIAEMNETVGNAFETGGEIFSNIFPILTDSLTTAINGVVKIIPNILNTAMKQLPSLTKSAAAIVIQLAQGISDNSGEMLNTLAEVATSIVEILTGPDVLSNLLSAVLNLIANLTTGIIGMIPTIISVIPTIITNVVTAITENIPILLEMIPTIINSVVSVLLESIPLIIDTGVTLLTALVEALPDIIDNIVAVIPEIITAVVNALIELAPELVSAGVQLLTAIIENLPEIITTIVAAIPEIITAIVTALAGATPTLIQTGITLFTSIVDNLPEIITGIVSALPEIITGIVNAFMENLPIIAGAGVELFVAIITGIPEAVVKIVEAIPQVITAIKDAFLSVDWGDIGRQLINGIGEGFKNGVEKVKEKFKEGGEKLKDGLKDFFGIHSPSKMFAEMGEYLALGLGEGWEDTIPDVTKNINGSMNFSAAAPETKTASDGLGGVTININGIQYQDFNDLAVAISEQLQFLADRRALGYGD